MCFTFFVRPFPSALPVIEAMLREDPNNRKRDAEPQWVEVGTGLRDAEIVLRGGLLEAPIVLQDCVKLGDVTFMSVASHSKHMEAMLTGSRYRRRASADSYAECSVLGDMIRLRNAEGRRKLFEGLRDVMAREQPATNTAQADALGQDLDLDETPSSTSGGGAAEDPDEGSARGFDGPDDDHEGGYRKTFSRRMMKKAEMILPKTVEIEIISRRALFGSRKFYFHRGPSKVFTWRPPSSICNNWPACFVQIRRMLFPRASAQR